MNDEIKKSLNSIQRRHNVSIRRLRDIEKRLEEVRTETEAHPCDEVDGGGLVRWFRSFISRLSGRADDHAA